VKSLAELDTVLADDHHAVSVWLILKMVAGAIELGGETRTLTQLAATTGQYLFRIEEILWLTGTVAGAEPTDADAIESSELLLQSAMVRTDWRTAAAPASTDVHEKCKPPGAWAAWAGSVALAPLLGYLAHEQISKAYISQLGLTPEVNVYLDDPFAGGVDPGYVKFLKRMNPRLPLTGRVLLALHAFARPDLVAHRPGLKEFEEIKSNSLLGRARGDLKVRAIKWWYNLCGLTYTPGTAYVPQKFDVWEGKALDLDYVVKLRVIRDQPGLITYEYCITTDWEKATAYYTALIIFLLILIAIILSRGRLRLPPGIKLPPGFEIPPWMIPPGVPT
jgi:hypothetical protein